MDDSGNRLLNRAEFSAALGEIGVGVNRNQFDHLMKYFDKNGDGNISFDEFLNGLRGQINPRRMGIVHKAFKKLDRTGDGVATAEDLAGVFNLTHHPKVKSGEMSKAEAMGDFLSSFEGTSGNGDGIVTLKEFENYYASVSASIDLDEYFIDMVGRAWGVRE